MNRYAVMGVLIGIALLSGAGIAWQAWIASPTLSPAQIKFLDILDWVLKGSIGALIGFLTGSTGYGNRHRP